MIHIPFKNTNRALFRIFSILGLLICMSTSIYAQGTSNKDKLIGTWTLDYNKTLSKVNSEAKQHYDAFDSSKKQSLEASFTQRKMTFEDDGSYTLVVNSKRQVTGTWRLKKDGATLDLKTNGRSVTHKIGKISNQNLELHLQKSANSKQLFNTWYLNKVSN